MLFIIVTRNEIILDKNNIFNIVTTFLATLYNKILYNNQKQ